MARPKRKINTVMPVLEQKKPEQRIYRTGGYSRLSVEDSGKPGADTLEIQAALIQDYISKQPDMQLIDLFFDNGYSGTNFERPAFERMMEKVRTGKIDCIVVKDLSRFGRNYLETGNYLERIFPFLDVRFVAINDHFDTLTAEHSNDGYIIPLKNILNAAYSKDISRKSSSVLAIKRQNGEFTGSWAPYGYLKCASDHNQIEPNEETAPVVKNIFRWRLSGMGIRRIAQRLNELDIPSPSKYLYEKGIVKTEHYANSIWQAQTVKKILSGEVYIGHMVQGCKRSGLCEGRKQYRTPKSEWVIVRNTHEPLITEEVFNAAKMLAEERQAAHKARLGCYDSFGTIPNTLKGLIYCADCKHALIRSKCVTKAGKRYYVYICSTHKDAPFICKKKYIHETKLKAMMWKILQAEIKLALNMESLVCKYNVAGKQKNNEKCLENETSAANRALNRAKTLHETLYQDYIDHLISEQKYMELKRKYKSDIENAKTRLDAVTQKINAEQQAVKEDIRLKSCQSFCKEDELTEEMAHMLIERVEVSADNHISIVLRFRDEFGALSDLSEKAGMAAPL